MKIAIDLEGVLADIHSTWIKDHNRKNSTSFAPENITYYDFYNRRNAFGISKTDFFQGVIDMWNDGFERIPPTEKGLESTITELTKNHDVKLVTGSVGNTENIKRWLALNKIPLTLVHEKNKLALEFEVFIDDDPKMAENAESFRKTVLLYDRPYNRGVGDSKYVKRIKGMKEVELILKGMKNE